MTGWAGVRRTAGTLADGRQILYFDDSEPYLSGGASRDVADHRPLGEASVAGERRLDPLTGEWVAIAAHRMNRTFLPPADGVAVEGTGRARVSVAMAMHSCGG